MREPATRLRLRHSKKIVLHSQSGGAACRGLAQRRIRLRAATRGRNGGYHCAVPCCTARAYFVADACVRTPATGGHPASGKADGPRNEAHLQAHQQANCDFGEDGLAHSAGTCFRALHIMKGCSTLTQPVSTQNPVISTWTCSLGQGLNRLSVWGNRAADGVGGQTAYSPVASAHACSRQLVCALVCVSV